MAGALLGWCIKSKAVKVGGGILGGSGALILILGLHASVNKRIDTVKIGTQTYVNQKHDLVTQQINHLKDGQREIKDMLKIIDKRLYNLKINR